MNKNNKGKIGQKAGSCLFRLVVGLLIVVAAYALYREFLYEPLDLPGEGEVGLRMVDIIDGDTGELSTGVTVRYLGIDTPEEGDPYSYEATRLNSRLCAGKEVRLEYDHKKRDKYDRALAYVFVEDTIMVNEVIVRAGLAVVYIFPQNQRNVQYRRRLIVAQMQAREENRGIWSLPTPEPIEESYFGNPNSFRFHRPDCRSLKRSDESRLLDYPTRDDFLDLGFSPCRICKP